MSWNETTRSNSVLFLRLKNSHCIQKCLCLPVLSPLFTLQVLIYMYMVNAEMLRECKGTCSAEVGLRSWFRFSSASLNAVSSEAGFTRGKAISHWKSCFIREPHKCFRDFVWCISGTQIVVKHPFLN